MTVLSFHCRSDTNSFPVVWERGSGDGGKKWRCSVAFTNLIDQATHTHTQDRIYSPYNSMSRAIMREWLQ